MWKNTGTGATPGGGWSNGIPGMEDRSISNAAWYNMMQEELQNLVTGAGLVLTEGNHTQVLAAVLALAKSNGFETGDAKITTRTAASAGWLLMNDGTIGSATSGATALAHASAQALYLHLWNTFSQTYAPVTGGRGANAAADWAANKPIALTKQLGRAIAVAGHGAGLTDRPLGATVGAESHEITEDELPEIQLEMEFEGFSEASGGTTNHDGFVVGVDDTSLGSLTNSVAIKPFGGGEAMSLMQPTSFWNVMIKL